MTLQAPTTFSTLAPEVEMVATHQLSGGESIITTLVIIRPSEPICPPDPSKQAALPIWCSSALSTIDKVLDRRRKRDSDYLRPTAPGLAEILRVERALGELIHCCCRIVPIVLGDFLRLP
ncbi:hypothetical protein ASPTUDRAFT_916317 [Aspergillus tubingensis CBS 134.48]|uniref:Uncharacterized protein n=1 Tax=Aspergillus tubingensis (strain CBS 134.48) TaxID=767770 RepID=A0A1L9NQB1_ASPTC|nr:hypothetical protein ASPTUDRAFT_916317 [Aspergillus tubingensis CBS 134.48]